MRLVKQREEYIYQEPTIIGAFKMVELAGRISYKSEDKITEDSWLKFAKMLKEKGHLSPFEFGTIYLTIEVGSPLYDEDYIEKMDSILFYGNNPFSKTIEEPNEDKTGRFYYITTNLRVLLENNRLYDLKYSTEIINHLPRYCFRLILSRDISHEFVRHRSMSLMQESSRYCNYSKGKFNNECTFIIPVWLEHELKGGSYNDDSNKIADIDNQTTRNFLFSLSDSEEYYFDLIRDGWQPQQARQVLPNALKTELMMCGFESDWHHFFDLRCSPAAHPSARQLAEAIREDFNTIKNEKATV